MTVSTSKLFVTDSQFERAIEDLKKLVAIPSVSNPSSPDYNPQHLDEAAHFLEEKLEKLGFEVWNNRIQGSPLFVMGSRVADPTQPTVLLYGHYDVQPVDRMGWDSDPFSLEDKNDRLYGRGASDDKSGIIVVLAALNALAEAEKTIPFNVKVLFEGEEEFGTNKIRTLLEEECEALASDALLIFDGVNRSIDTGCIESATRGVLTMSLRVDALEKPTHSGMGCLAPDPALALAGLIHSLRDPRTIKGFMDDCVFASPEEQQILDADSLSEGEYKKTHGVLAGAQLRGDPKSSIYHRLLEEPSISILNMTCGQPDGGNSIQSSAECLLGVRLTAGQNPDKIEQFLRDHFASQNTLYGLSFTFSRAGLSARSWKTDPSRPYVTKYLQALKSRFPQTAVVPTGATIPFLSHFQIIFPEMETFIVGVEDPESAAHSHNESQSKVVLRRAIDCLMTFLAQG